MPDAYGSELTSEALLMGSLADEAGFDSARAAKASSYDAMRKSRTRGRQSNGGRLALRCTDRSELVLEEWELQQLVRLLPPDLARKLRPSPNPRGADVAQAIADALATGHPHRSFFNNAAIRHGFQAVRA